jgi:hypothetical protein
MQVRIPSYKEIKNKMVEYPYVTYFGFLGVICLGSYAFARKTASAYDPYDAVLDDMYEHMKAGDHLVVTFDEEKFHYAPFDPDEQAS